MSKGHQLSHPLTHLPMIYNGLAAMQGGPARRAGILFGGCLYDTDNNRPVNDYDLLVPVIPGEYPEASARRFAAAVGGTATLFGTNGTRYYIHVPDAPTVDINFSLKAYHQNAEYMAGMAPVGLAGIAMDLAQERVVVTDTHLRDKAENTLSLLDPGQLDYAIKLHGKYPTHTLIDRDTRRVLRAGTLPFRG